MSINWHNVTNNSQKFINIVHIYSNFVAIFSKIPPIWAPAQRKGWLKGFVCRNSIGCSTNENICRGAFGFARSSCVSYSTHAHYPRVSEYVSEKRLNTKLRVVCEFTVTVHIPPMQGMWDNATFVYFASLRIYFSPHTLSK